MRHQDRQVGVAQNTPGEATEDHFTNTAMAVTTHNQQIGLCRRGGGQQHIYRRTPGSPQALYADRGVLPAQRMAEPFA